MKRLRTSMGVLSVMMFCSVFASGLNPVFADSKAERVEAIVEAADEDEVVFLKSGGEKKRLSSDVMRDRTPSDATKDDADKDLGSEKDTDDGLDENPDMDGDEIPALQDKVIYQKNLVRFVTAWHEEEKHGAAFSVTEDDAYPIAEDCMESASYKLVSDGFDENQDAVAVWDVLYKDDAKMLHTLPELVKNPDDAFLGWVDADGNEVDAKTPVTGGVTYYAEFASGIVGKNTETGILDSDENKLFQNSAEVTFMLTDKPGEVFGTFGELKGLKREGIDAIKMTADEISVKVSYDMSTDGVTLGVLPEVVPADGFELGGWTVTQVGDVTPTEATSSIRIVNEKEPVYDGMVAVAYFVEIDDEPDDNDSDDGNSDDDKKDDENKGDIHGDITVDKNPSKPDNKDSNQNDQNSQNNTNKDSSTGEAPKLVLYVLHVTDAAGGTKEVKVQSNKTVAELADALGYSSVNSFAVKQANIQEYKINSDMTMESVVSLFKNGDIQVIAYGSDNKAIGCAVAKQTDKEYEYDVMLSKDTNVALRSASEIKDGKTGTDVDGKGKDEEKVSKEGKSDSTAPSVKTGDSFSWMLYLGVAVVLIAGIGGYFVYLRYRKKSEE